MLINNFGVIPSSGSTVASPYTDNMIQFFSIPGASGKIRLKVEKPTSATGVMLRWKATAWASGDTEATGTLIATITDDANYKDANEWYEATGLTNGTAYYIKAFPYNSSTVYNVVIGSNETLCKAGGLHTEYTMDSISGSTINDTSGNSNNGTLGGCTSGASVVGNGIDKPSSADSAQISSFPSFPLTLCFWVKTTRSGYPVYLYNGSYAVCGLIYNGTSLSFSASSAFTVNVSANANHFVVLKITGTTATVKIDNTSAGTYTLSGASANYKYFCGANAAGDVSCGLVDQFRFFSRAIEDYEDVSLWNGGAGC